MIKKNIYTLKVTSLNYKILNTFKYFLVKFFNKISIFTLPIKSKRITLLKSPHVFKKAREQFEIKKYSFIITLDLKYYFDKLILNKPSSIEVIVLKKH